MPEAKINLKGWQAAVVLVVLAGVVAVRLLTIGDKTDDTKLMRSLEVQLMCDYYPNEVAKLQAAYDSGDEDQLEEVAESVTSARLKIESVKTSSPLFNFSTSKDIVVEVTYSLEDNSGTRDRKTKYYLYNHGSLLNVWQYEYETTAVSYYLNFL